MVLWRPYCKKWRKMFKLGLKMQKIEKLRASAILQDGAIQYGRQNKKRVMAGVEVIRPAAMFVMEVIHPAAMSVYICILIK